MHRSGLKNVQNLLFEYYLYIYYFSRTQRGCCIAFPLTFFFALDGSFTECPFNSYMFFLGLSFLLFALLGQCVAFHWPLSGGIGRTLGILCYEPGTHAASIFFSGDATMHTTLWMESAWCRLFRGTKRNTLRPIYYGLFFFLLFFLENELYADVGEFWPVFFLSFHLLTMRCWWTKVLLHLLFFFVVSCCISIVFFFFSFLVIIIYGIQRFRLSIFRTLQSGFLAQAFFVGKWKLE